jgi:hypothetical protein
MNFAGESFDSSFSMVALKNFPCLAVYYGSTKTIMQVFKSFHRFTFGVI